MSVWQDLLKQWDDLIQQCSQSVKNHELLTRKVAYLLQKPRKFSKRSRFQRESSSWIQRFKHKRFQQPLQIRTPGYFVSAEMIYTWFVEHFRGCYQQIEFRYQSITFEFILYVTGLSFKYGPTQQLITHLLKGNLGFVLDRKPIPCSILSSLFETSQIPEDQATRVQTFLFEFEQTFNSLYLFGCCIKTIQLEFQQLLLENKFCPELIQAVNPQKFQTCSSSLTPEELKMRMESKFETLIQTELSAKGFTHTWKDQLFSRDSTAAATAAATTATLPPFPRLFKDTEDNNDKVFLPPAKSKIHFLAWTNRPNGRPSKNKNSPRKVLLSVPKPTHSSFLLKLTPSRPFVFDHLEKLGPVHPLSRSCSLPFLSRWIQYIEIRRTSGVLQFDPLFTYLINHIFLHLHSSLGQILSLEQISKHLLCRNPHLFYSSFVTLFVQWYSLFKSEDFLTLETIRDWNNHLKLLLEMYLFPSETLDTQTKWLQRCFPKFFQSFQFPILALQTIPSV